MTNITVIGAGEVFRKRYLSATAILHKKYDLNITDVVDVRSPDLISAELCHKSADNRVRVHQLLDTTSQGLVNLLKSQNLPRQVIISTPTVFHVPYATALLKHHMMVCVEKPFAATRQQVDEFDKVVREIGINRLFLLEYYALEKGLPAFVLANKNSENSQLYLNYLIPKVKSDLIQDVRSKLGRVQRIHAVLLEGSGSASRLDQRSWVLEPSSGGNTLETFYHLICMALPFLGQIKQIEINGVELACHRTTAEWFRQSTGKNTAETLTYAYLKTQDGIETRLVCAKYVPESLHERWMDIEFEHGRAFVDFENCTLKVMGLDFDLCLSLRFKTKYATQFALFAEKLQNSSNPTEYAIFRDALIMTFDIRDKGLKSSINKYDSGDLARPQLWKHWGFDSVIKPLAK